MKPIQDYIRPQSKEIELEEGDNWDYNIRDKVKYPKGTLKLWGDREIQMSRRGVEYLHAMAWPVNYASDYNAGFGISELTGWAKLKFLLTGMIWSYIETGKDFRIAYK